MLTWAITGPMLAFGVVGPAFGKAGDLWGHKRVFIGGLLGAAVFAVLTALSWNALSMIVFRTLSASAGAATGPSTMAYINRLFAPEDRVKPLSYWSFVNAGAPVIGVVVGAALVESVGWRAIFVVQAPMCLIGARRRAVVVAEHQPHRSGQVRCGRIGHPCAWRHRAVGRHLAGSHWGWSSAATIGCFAASALGLRLFVRVEGRAEAPLLLLQWFRTRNIAFPMLSQSLTNFAYMGGFSVRAAAARERAQPAENRNRQRGDRAATHVLDHRPAGRIRHAASRREDHRCVGALCVVASMLVFAGGARHRRSGWWSSPSGCPARASVCPARRSRR